MCPRYTSFRFLCIVNETSKQPYLRYHPSVYPISVPQIQSLQDTQMSKKLYQMNIYFAYPIISPPPPICLFKRMPATVLGYVVNMFHFSCAVRRFLQRCDVWSWSPSIERNLFRRSWLPFAMYFVARVLVVQHARHLAALFPEFEVVWGGEVTATGSLRIAFWLVSGYSMLRE